MNYEISEIKWEFPINKHRYYIEIIKEEKESDEDWGYSAVCLNLPGAGSCGDTVEEALENVKEAIVGLVETYEEENMKIPFRELDFYTIRDCKILTI